MCSLPPPPSARYCPRLRGKTQNTRVNNTSIPNKRPYKYCFGVKGSKRVTHVFVIYSRTLFNPPPPPRQIILKLQTAATTAQEASRPAEFVALQGAGNLVRRLVEALGSNEAALYDCAVVVYNLAAAAAATVAESGALQKDLVGEGGVFPALETLAGVRWG